MTSSEPSRERLVGVPGEVSLGRPRLAAGVIVLGALAPLLLGIDGVWPWQASSNVDWTLRIDEVAHQASEEIAGRKVLLVGGSAMAFAVNPATLSARLGVPVVNYGVHAGLGLDQIVERAVAMVRPGDVVVLGAELNHFQIDQPINQPLRGDWSSHFGLHDADPESRVPRRQWMAARGRCQRIIENGDRWLFERWQAVFPPPPRKPTDHQSPYDLGSIASRGGIATARPGPVAWLALNLPQPKPESFDFAGSNGRRAMERLVGVCRERGAVALMLHAPICDDTRIPRGWRAAFTDRERELERIAAALGMANLIPPGEMAFSHEDAFDTTYHLNDKGVAALEERLARALGPFVAGLKQ